MKKNLLIVFTILFFGKSMAQNLLQENFNFTGNLSANGWAAHFNAGVNPIQANTNSLSFPNYVLSGVGFAANVNNDGEDDNKTFAAQSSGDLYVSFLIKVNSSPGIYVLHFGTPTPSGSSTYFGRVHIINDGTGDFEFGLSHNTTASQVQTNNNYTFGNTYCVVMRYSFVAGTNNNVVSLYVFDAIFPNTEPASPTITTFGAAAPTSEPASLGSICLRQNDVSQNFVADGISVSTAWAGLNVIPVTLTSFTGEYKNGNTSLEWKTENEINNNRFEIEQSINGRDFTKVGTVAAGNAALHTKSYQFTHINPAAGNNFYRLKQIDNDGKYTFSNTIRISVSRFEGVRAFYSAGKNITVTTNSNFSSFVQLSLCSTDGRQLSTCGITLRNNYEWKLANQPAPGIYYIKITGSGQTVSLPLFIQ